MNPSNPPAAGQQSDKKATADLPPVPSSWPGARGIYKYAKLATQVNISTIILLWVVATIISILLDWQLHFVGQLASYLVTAFATVGVTLAYVAGVRRQKVSLEQSIRNSFPHWLWLKLYVLNVLVVLSYIFSFLLLVVPFFFVFPRLVLANYFLVDKKMGILEAYKASWHATDGNKGKAWGIAVWNIVIFLLMFTVIGIPFAIYFLIMYSSAYAVLYEYLNKHPSAAPAPAQPTQPAQPTVPAAT